MMQSGKHMAIGVAVVAAIVGVATAVFIVPNYREANTVRVQVADLQARVETLAEREAELDLLEQQVRNAREQVLVNLKTIPETADVAGLIRNLSDRIDGVNVLEQTFAAGTAGPAIIGDDRVTARSMPVAADMRATFESVLALIAKAETMPRLVRVASVRLQCKREDERSAANSMKGSGAAVPASVGSVPVLSASIGLEAIFDSDQGDVAGDQESKAANHPVFRSSTLHASQPIEGGI